MMAKDEWLANMLDSLEHGEYWHVPSDNTLLKMDKENRKLSVIIGEWGSTTVERLYATLPQLGYSLSLKNEKTDYYCS